MHPVSTALIGFGKAGQWLHAPFIHTSPFFSFEYILERTAGLAPQLYPSVKTVKDITVILNSDVELIVIATPNDTHVTFILAALEAGKHVVVDKPFTVTLTQAVQVREASIQTGKNVFVYQNRRWDGDFLTVKKLLEQKLLGDILAVKSRFDRYRPAPRTGYWKESATPGNGLWYDLGPHLLDQALCLFGKPEAVLAELKTMREGGDGTDYFDVELQYSTFTYTVHAGMLEEKPTPRWNIKGSLASYIKYGTDPQEAHLSRHEMPLGPDWGRATDQEANGILTFETGITQSVVQEAGDYRLFYQHVYDSIREERSFPVSINDAVTLVAYLERIQSIAGQGKTTLVF